MSIRFPAREEVALQSPPLKEVVCQVRIPPILSIATELPTAFQDRVRGRFPQLEVEQGVDIAFAPLINEADVLTRARPKIYRFKSNDLETSISLAVDFYALSTSRYRHWHEFANDLQFAHDAMMATYSPTNATRIGLRYINSLTPQNTATASREELLELLEPTLTTLLKGDIGDSVADLTCRLTFVEELAGLNIRFSYDEENEREFVLDLDYFEKGNLPLEGLVDRCHHYHNVVYNAFRWCLRDSALDRFNGQLSQQGV